MDEFVRPLVWVASARKDLQAMPEMVQDAVGYALYFAQTGREHERAKALKSFGSAGVLEVIEDADGGTFRAVYTVRFSNAVYVLHCFQRNPRMALQPQSPTWN
jgi:phage-related protein